MTEDFRTEELLFMVRKNQSGSDSADRIVL